MPELGYYPIPFYGGLNYAPKMPLSTLTWDSLQALSSDAEAASVSRFCLFSFATPEIACSPGTTNIAMVEQEHTDTWRWLVISPDGFMVDAGSEPTQAYAKKAVEQALRLEAPSPIAISKG
jgi:hypothetical protein